MRLSPFQQHIKSALEHYHDADWLKAHSPLAAPYVLGTALHTSPYVGWGEELRTHLYAAALSLWGAEPPASVEAIEHEVRQPDHTDDQYAFWVLTLAYFHTFIPPDMRAPLRQATIYDDILHVSRATFDRHLHAAIERLGERLLERVQPTLHPERPGINTWVVGRADLKTRIIGLLGRGESVSLTGAGGVGKTALGIIVADAWPTEAFWFTMRPGLNDRLTPLLFALGAFLQRQGRSSLWQHVVAQGGGTLDATIAGAALRHDVERMPSPPLVCIDEVDELVARDAESVNPHHQQMLAFLDSVRGDIPTLLIGQRVALPTDHEIAVPTLDIVAVDEVLDTVHGTYTSADTARMHAVTGGNPRLIHLLLSPHDRNAPLADILADLPSALPFSAVVGRVWGRLNATEQAVMLALSVVRGAVPVQSLDVEATERLINAALVTTDSDGGVSLVGAVQHALMARLDVETRHELHRAAAAMRAGLGEYTEAAFHYVQADEPASAIAAWYDHMETEIARGFGTAALDTFGRIAATALEARDQRHLALIRARLLRLAGDADAGLDALRHATWNTPDFLTVQKLGHEGFFRHLMGDADRALSAYEDGIVQIDTLLRTRADLLVEIGRVHQRKRDTARARVAVQRIKFEQERLQGIIEEETGNTAEARTRLWSALATAERLDDPALIADAYYHLAIVEARVQQGGSALDFFTKAMHHYERTGDLFQVERTRSNIAALFVQLEQYADVIAPGRAALLYFERIRHPLMIAAVAANLAEASCYIGALDAAEGYAALVMAQEEQAYVPYALYTLGLVGRARGDHAAAAEFFERAAAVAEQNDDPHLLVYARQQSGIIALDRGDAAAARPLLADALRMFEALQLHRDAERTQALLDACAKRV